MRSQSLSSLALLSSVSLGSAASLAFKAGLSGFPGIQTSQDFRTTFGPYISWYSNYEPIAPNFQTTTHTVLGAPMLWGKGDQCLTASAGPFDAWRYDNFTTYVSPNGSTPAENPAVMFGFYEPDCNCDSSSHIPDVGVAVKKWNQLIKPLSARGVKLGSPPMCTQLDETWLSAFADAGVTWDITSIHVNKPTAKEGMAVVEYYAKKFGKPVWVSEFTCVNDKTWTSCGDQTVVNKYIDQMVDYMEGNDAVIAYGANTGEGVPGVWNLVNNGQLTATGQHYLSVLKNVSQDYMKC